MSTGATADHTRRALITYDALRARLCDESSGLFRDVEPHLFGRRAGADLWPFANAWSATCVVAGLPDGERYRPDLDARLATLASYSRDGAPERTGVGRTEAGAFGGFSSRPVPPIGAGGDVYYDDNAWIALALLHQHRLTGDGQLLVLARRVFDFALTSWSTEHAWAAPGGLRWAEPTWSTTRNTCVAAPVAEAGALLFEATGDDVPLGWAERIYAWVRATLLRGDGCYADRIDADGTVHAERWSYNQGTMIGAGLLLHQATGEQRYLDEARATGAASLSWLSAPEELDRQGPPFLAIYLRNALMLGRLDGDTAYAKLGATYAQRRWTTERDGRSGLFARDGHQLGPTAGMVSIYGHLAGSEPRP